MIQRRNDNGCVVDYLCDWEYDCWNLKLIYLFIVHWLGEQYCSGMSVADARTELQRNPDSKVHEAYMGPTQVLSDPGGPYVGPMNLVIREYDDFDTQSRAFGTSRELWVSRIIG